VFQQATVKVSHQYFLILANVNDCDHPRLGLVVGKKHCRLAVGRNRIKRHIRETFRHQQHHLPSIDAIVLPRSGADQLSDKDLHQLLDQQWQRLAKRSREHSQSQQS
jgi:ribonuclease P protein component